MSDFNFLKIDANKIYSELINDFEAASGEVLYNGDERRIFISQLVPVLVALKSEINETGKQNLLAYSMGDNLDNLGIDIYDTTRLQANKAIAKGKITLVGPQARLITIPSGKRVTPDGNLFFIIKDEVTIMPNETTKECVLEAIEAGVKYNNFLPGQIKNITDPIPYVSSIENIETSHDGSDIESDQRYRVRCKLSNKGKSTTGPTDSYRYNAMSADVSIKDVYPYSPSPGVVELVVLLNDGGIPTTELLNKVIAKTSAKDIRPLTDNVQAVAPTSVNYNIDIKYFIDKDFASEELSIRKAVEGVNLNKEDGAIRDYIKWQYSELGRSVNPDMLLFYLQNSYTRNDKTAISRVEITSPLYTNVNEKSIAKPGTITVTYGGLK